MYYKMKKNDFIAFNCVSVGFFFNLMPAQNTHVYWSIMYRTTKQKIIIESLNHEIINVIRWSLKYKLNTFSFINSTISLQDFNLCVTVLINKCVTLWASLWYWKTFAPPKWTNKYIFFAILNNKKSPWAFQYRFSFFSHFFVFFFMVFQY